MFTFKQFVINDAHCGMKVGTDGVLLGAWANVGRARRVLDVGCGSGVVALMAAQRNTGAEVTGVEIDPAAAGDARANAAASPFTDRVKIICADVLALTMGNMPPFDCILANPPYHEEDLLPPSAQRAAARHTAGGGLTFAALLRAANNLLCPDGGIFSLILPSQAVARFEALAGAHGLYASQRTAVVTRPGKPPKRTLLELTRHATPPVCDTLVLLSPDGTRSPQYAALCSDFYL